MTYLERTREWRNKRPLQVLQEKLDEARKALRDGKAGEIHIGKGVNTAQKVLDDIEFILNVPHIDMDYWPLDVYDPEFGDHKDCECGHSYERHFDTYEDMAPVGCKYCHCGVWQPPEETS